MKNIKIEDVLKMLAEGKDVSALKAELEAKKITQRTNSLAWTPATVEGLEPSCVYVVDAGGAVKKLDIVDCIGFGGEDTKRLSIAMPLKKVVEKS